MKTNDKNYDKEFKILEISLLSINLFFTVLLYFSMHIFENYWNNWFVLIEQFFIPIIILIYFFVLILSIKGLFNKEFKYLITFFQSIGFIYSLFAFFELLGQVSILTVYYEFFSQHLTYNMITILLSLIFYFVLFKIYKDKASSQSKI